MLKLISWNVNGIRAILNKNFLESIKELNPDILCLQETKAHPSQLDEKIKQLSYKNCFWHSAEKKGYSGTAVFSKIKPLSVEYGLKENNKNIDNEGRIITLEFKKFYLLNLYVPNAKRDLSRLEEKSKEWWPKLFRYIKKLESKKPVIICGDLNVAHKEIDLKNPQSNKTTKTKPGHAGFTDTERNDFQKLLDLGYIDTFRYLYPDKIQYTWWSYMFNARQKNIGWRIDYFLISEKMKDKLIDSKIHDKIMGSDHCPIELDINISE